MICFWLHDTFHQHRTVLMILLTSIVFFVPDGTFLFLMEQDGAWFVSPSDPVKPRRGPHKRGRFVVVPHSLNPIQAVKEVCDIQKCARWQMCLEADMCVCVCACVRYTFAYRPGALGGRGELLLPFLLFLTTFLSCGCSKAPVILTCRWNQPTYGLETEEDGVVVAFASLPETKLEKVLAEPARNRKLAKLNAAKAMLATLVEQGWVKIEHH
jgi:hypothetical protein